MDDEPDLESILAGAGGTDLGDDDADLNLDDDAMLADLLGGGGDDDDIDIGSLDLDGLNLSELGDDDVLASITGQASSPAPAPAPAPARAPAPDTSVVAGGAGTDDDFDVASGTDVHAMDPEEAELASILAGGEDPELTNILNEGEVEGSNGGTEKDVPIPQPAPADVDPEQPQETIGLGDGDGVADGVDSAGGDVLNDDFASEQLMGQEEFGSIADIEIHKAPKPMGFGIKFGSMSVESLINLTWPGKYEEEGVEERMNYIVVSRLHEETDTLSNPALEAGVVAGDVVLEMNGVPVFSNTDMKAANKKGATSLRLRVAKRTGVMGNDSIEGLDVPDPEAVMQQQSSANTTTAIATNDDLAENDEVADVLKNFGGDATGLDDTDLGLSELGLELNMDLSDLTRMTAEELADGDDSLAALIGGDGSSGLTAGSGQRHTYTVQRRKKFGFGILFALVPVDKLDFDFNGKGQNGVLEVCTLLLETTLQETNE